MADKLEVYNGALRLLGQRELQSLSENTDQKRALDQIWNSATRACLEGGMWNFAIRAIEANDDPSVEPTFGYSYAFKIPNDWMRTTGVYSDILERNPLVDYAFEQGYFYANLTPIYIRFVSSDPQYGMDLGKWSMAFQRYVEANIAASLCGRLGGDTTKQTMLIKLERSLAHAAENKNAMDLPARFPPLGSWSTSRLNRFRASRINGTGRGL
jgi:hypothetical protein